MSQFYEEDVFNAMEDDGTADWIRRTVAEANGEEAPESTAEAPEQETVEAEEEVEIDPEAEAAAEADAAEEETPESEQDETTSESGEEDVLYLDLDPETQALLDTKYGGDLNAMLRAAREAQTLIGRQGNELGELRPLREELAQIRAEMQVALNRPQVEWPDEYTDEADAVRAYRQIANDAFDREDRTTFDRAMEAWQEVDPLGMEAWAMNKATQVMLSTAPAGGTPEEAGSLEDGVVRLAQTYPQLSDEGFQKEVMSELEKFPTLQRTFQDQTASPAERVAALEEAAKLVASRQADGDVRQAVRRAVVVDSEEARKSRAAARVATGGGRGKPTAPADRQILVGDTGATVGENELKERIKELTGMDVQVGGSTWKPDK